MCWLFGVFHTMLVRETLLQEKKKLTVFVYLQFNVDRVIEKCVTENMDIFHYSIAFSRHYYMLICMV